MSGRCRLKTEVMGQRDVKPRRQVIFKESTDHLHRVGVE
jgi:hypothetical protein